MTNVEAEAATTDLPVKCTMSPALNVAPKLKYPSSRMAHARYTVVTASRNAGPSDTSDYFKR